MSIDLNTLSLDELKKLQKDVTKAITTFEIRAKAEARVKLEAQAAEMGFSLAELLEPAGAKRTVSAPKYRHPEKPEMTWTGKGRKPFWLVEALEGGAQLEDFLIGV